MKWFLVGSACLLCSAGWVRGDAASDLYNQGINQLNAGQNDAAAQTFDKIITGYPTTQLIDDVRIRAGYAYYLAGKFKESIDHFAKEAAPNAKPQYRAPALYYTGLAQFYNAQKNNQKASYTQAITTFTTLLTTISQAPTDDNRGYAEQGLYYQALAEIELSNDDAAEKDLRQLLQSFPASLSRPDYYLRLGSVYATQVSDAVQAKKPQEEIQSLAHEALDAFDHVSRDPNALVQANDANLSKGGVYYLLAPSEPDLSGYQKALDAFRQVRRKADMIELQQKNIDDLKAASQVKLEQQLQQPSVSALSSDTSLLINREEGRLDDLKSGPDPVIQALIGIAECYVSMKQPDEARTILHRLEHAQLTPEQQQYVDYQTLYSYVLGGQSDQADKALTDYLSKHAGDPQADSISFQIARGLMLHKDYAGALKQAQRSIHDFPHGKYMADAIGVEAEALRQLGQIAQAKQVVDDFLKSDPKSPVANQLLLSRATVEIQSRDYSAALADYAQVRDNASAGPDLQSAAAAGYIQALQATGKFDDVISAAQDFASKFPTSKSLPSVLIFQGLAMDQKHDPGAVAQLQNVAKTYPKDEVAPFALYYVITIYQKTGNIPGMIQAAKDLATNYPDAYPLLTQTADSVSTVLIKEKKFDDAIALYQPLVDSGKADIASAANNKVGAIWLAAAKALGSYQSMPLATRGDAEKRLATGETTYLGTLQNYPDQLDAVGDAFDGLTAALKQRRSWATLTDVDLEGYLGKLCAGLTSTEMQARVEMAKAALVVIEKDGAKQYAQALDRFRKAAATGLRLTRQETDVYGDLLLAGQDYATAQKIYQDLLGNSTATDYLALGDAYYGLGATALAQGHLPQAKDYFNKLRALPEGGAWQPHILEAQYGIALADEQSTDPSDLAEAQQIYVALMQSQQAGVSLQAQAMLGYGRLLEKSGAVLKPSGAAPDEFAVHYYQEPHTLFGPAVPEWSAAGLFAAGQAFEKAGDKASAKKQYDDLLNSYAATAPDWAAKAKAATANLGA